MQSAILRATTLALAVVGLAACSGNSGSASNPPGTVVSRANDRIGDPVNADGRPDGTPGNPPGTVVSRANDRAGDPLNVNARPDCTPGNPPGTAVSRSLGTTDPADCRPVAQRSRRAARRTVARTPRPVAAPVGASGQGAGTGATGPGGSPAFTNQGS